MGSRRSAARANPTARRRLESTPKIRRFVEFMATSILFAFAFAAIPATTGFPVRQAKIGIAIGAAVAQVFLYKGGHF